MKRKICTTRSLVCEDDMEELNVAALSSRKESAAPLTEEREGNIFRHVLFSYPLALVLRLRVLQIVCGISAMVMGSVAFIEERQQFNMGLGIPAGGISVLAAAVSIHTARGMSGVMDGAVAGAVAGAGAGAGVVANLLWTAAGFFQLALIVQCGRTMIEPPRFDYGDGAIQELSTPSPRDLMVIASAQTVFAIITLLTAAICLRIDCSSQA